MKFNLTFASVQADREMEKIRNAETEREREKSCKVGWKLTTHYIRTEMYKCVLKKLTNKY